MADGNSIISDDELQAALAEATSEADDTVATIETSPDSEAQPSEANAEVDTTLDSIDEDLNQLQTILDNGDAGDVDEEPESDNQASETAGEHIQSEVEAAEVPPAVEETEEAEETSSEPTDEGRSTAAHTSDVPRILLTLTQRGAVTALVALDRPFRKISSKARKVAGYAAMATCVVAAATWVLGFYQG